MACTIFTIGARIHVAIDLFATTIGPIVVVTMATSPRQYYYIVLMGQFLLSH